MIRFEVFTRMTLRGRRHFFRIVSTGNNKTLAVSQAYKTADQPHETIRIIRRYGIEARVVDSDR